jgi:hypothetical protein
MLRRPRHIQIDKSQTSISCSKPPGDSVRIALITTEDDQDWISLPSAGEQKQSSVAAVNDAVNALRRETQALQKTLSDTKVDLSDTKVKLQTNHRIQIYICKTTRAMSEWHDSSK